MNSAPTAAPATPKASAAHSWLRALELTAPIARNPTRLLSTLIEELAERSPDAPALLSDRESFTYRELAARASQYARWALAQGLAKGEVVGLLMTNRPEYFAAWLGITSVGGVVALLNTNLVGPSLAHCINIVAPKHLIVASEFIDPLSTALPGLIASPILWTDGLGPHQHPDLQRIDLAHLSGTPLAADERPPLTIHDRALYIFTSGTTGLPKAASISHARILQWSLWSAGMMNAQPADRIYNCLPMYHSIGGVSVPGAVLAAGGSVVLREKFSASHFWTDIARWDCTLFQYIGELCRYLLHAPPSPQETTHRIRMACGNGLAPELWDAFKDRFQVPHILEFYAATEGGVSLFNVQGKRGAIGHIPAYLAHRFSPPLVLFDVERGEPARDPQGLCIRCAPGQIGEAIVQQDPTNIASRFEGYTDPRATDAKLLRNVFAPGDAWFRTGDLMRKDAQGFFYFVDRIGDTFRWKGENVATSEVAEAICAFPGIAHATVYGVAIPATEGRAGMAVLVLAQPLAQPPAQPLDLVAFRAHLIARLPAYARPLFLRISAAIEVTGTFKYSRTDLARQGYDPASIPDVLYFDDPASRQFIPLDAALYNRIQAGQLRL